MNSESTDLVAISGAKGFVGKNLRKFLSQHNIQSIPISRTNFHKNQFPQLKKVIHFVHLAGIGSESIEQKFQNVNKLAIALTVMLKELQQKRLFQKL